MAGSNAAWIAAGMEAEVVIIDRDVDRLRMVDQIHKGRILTVTSNRAAIEHHVERAVVHYGVGNMPGAVPRTSTYALTNVTLPYAVAIATHGLQQAVREDPVLAQGVNVYRGAVTSSPVAEAHGMEHAPLSRLIPGVD